MFEPWRVTLFGGLQARRGEQVITRFKSQKVASLFACLAYYPRQAHSREILIEMLWPESDVPTLRNSLSVALSSLRHQFEPPGTPQGSVLRADRFSVGLHPASLTTDTALFEQALQAAARADSRLERAQHLRQAVEIYQGPLLPGFYEEWIPAEQQRLSGLFFDAVGALVTHLEGIGDTRTALSHARHAVAADPFREEGQHHLIRLLAADGQPGAALQQYKEYERLLQEQIGAEPSAALRALFHQIEKASGLSVPASAAAPPPVSPPPTLLAPAGGVPRRHASPALAVSGGPATVTFLMTDIEGSARLLQQAGEAYRAARERHHALLRQAFSRQGGQEVTDLGDGFIVSFPTAGSALACAVACQKALAEEVWPEQTGEIKVRMALHTGDVPHSDEEEPSPDIVLHPAGRMLTAGHGGQILVSDTTASLVAGGSDSGVRLVDLGVYRLREAPEPKRLFQAEYPGMAQTDFGPLLAEAGHKANVPPRFTRFFGREEEMSRLRELLLSPEVRLVTLTGPGGNGKTRLSLEVAERLTEPFAGAVYFVALADLTDPALIAGAILDSLRVRRAPPQEPLEQAVEALCEKPVLLVLDNFEHLVEQGAALVQTLLVRVSSLKLLIASRQVLGLSAEQEFVLSPLPIPGIQHSPEALSLYQSVQLFIDRAQQVMPYFQVSNANAASVAALVGGLEGIPLAIELAATRVQVLTPAQMLAQLSHRLDFLASRKRDVAERHRTLRATLEWSYRLLSPQLQRFFSCLSVFRGGWTVEAAEQVCEEPLARDALEQLRECSLVLSGEVDGHALRCRMLETLREYAQERLAERKEADAVRDRHLAYFLALAEEAEAHLQGAEQAEWLSRLENDHDNLREAIHFSNEQRAISNEETGSERLDPGDAGLRLAVAMWRFWDMRSWLEEGRQMLASVLAHPARDGDMAARAKALNGAGVLATKQGDDQAARQLCEESLQIFRELDDLRGIAASLANLGMITSHQGDKEAAHALYQESLELQRALGNPQGVAVVLVNQGLIACDRGDYASARACYEECLALYQEMGNMRGVSYALHGLGQVAHFDRNITLARTFYEQSLALRRELGDHISAAATLHNLGLLAGQQQDYAAAHTFFMESLAIKRNLGNSRSIALTLNDLALLSVEQGDFAAASRFLHEALALRQELTDRLGMAECLQAAGEMKAAQGEVRQAARLFGSAENLCRSIGASLPPDEQARYENILRVARAALGEEAFSSAWEEGRAMSWEEAVAYALEE